jgi:pyruvyl transferase EpsO
MIPVTPDPIPPSAPSSGDTCSIMRSLASRVEQLATLVPADRPVVYLDYPVHLNIGDLLIEAGTEQFFTQFGYDIAEKRSAYDFGTLARHWMPKDSTILLHGGGNFGDLYPLHQKFRERVIAAYPKHRIVMLPQSMHFNSRAALAACAESFGRHEDLHICLRDEPSLDTVREHFRNPSYLLPDMAHLLWEPLEPHRIKPHGQATLLFARRDKESSAMALPPALSSQRGMDWNDLIGLENKAAYYTLAILHRNRGESGGKLSLHPMWRILRNRLIAKSVRFLGDYDSVVTNRLHMGLLSLLLGRKVTLADNSYGKLTRYHAAWLSGMADAQVS